MMHSSAPTSTVSSSSTLISCSVPATGEGISVSTLSVETSSSGSSTSTSSPTDFSHRVMVPSVTDSPRAGSVTGVPPPPPPLFLAAGFSAGSSSPSSADSSDSSDSSESSDPSESSADSSASSADSSPDSSSASSDESSDPDSSSEPESEPPPSPSSPTTHSSAPTSTVSSSSALISSSVPATGEGISVSTLSVETSSKGSSTSTVSPTCLSHRVMVPSVTDSPSSGSFTGVDIGFLRSSSWSGSRLDESVQGGARYAPLMTHAGLRCRQSPWLRHGSLLRLAIARPERRSLAHPLGLTHLSRVQQVMSGRATVCPPVRGGPLPGPRSGSDAHGRAGPHPPRRRPSCR